MLLPQGIFAQAIATVAFPSFSAQVARKELAQLRSAISSVLGMVFFLTLPATIGLVVLRRQLVEMLFMRGEFDRRAATMVAWALAWYAVGLVAHSGLEIVTRAFYAMHDTATPVWIGGGAMALNIVFSVLLSGLFATVGERFFAGVYAPWMPLGGLALANSVATTLETMTLAYLLNRRLEGLDVRRLWSSLWRVLIGVAVMGAALVGFLKVMSAQNAWILGIGGIAAGAAAFFLTVVLLRSPELASVLAVIRRRSTR
jgi:putative peptidoglycan lipid II flippase